MVEHTHSTDRFAMSPRRIKDADWFGLEANPSGTVHVPVTDPYAVQPAQGAVRGGENDERDCRRPARRH